MAEKIQVEMKMKQWMEDEMDENITVSTGQRFDKGGKIFLSFQQMIQEEEGTVDTMIKLSDSYMSVTQMREAQVKMEFITGKRTRCNYATPMGVIVMDIFTKSYQLMKQPKELSVFVEYEVAMNEVTVSANQMRISVQTLEPQGDNALQE